MWKGLVEVLARQELPEVQVQAAKLELLDTQDLSEIRDLRDQADPPGSLEQQAPLVHVDLLVIQGPPALQGPLATQVLGDLGVPQVHPGPPERLVLLAVLDHRVQLDLEALLAQQAPLAGMALQVLMDTQGLQDQWVPQEVLER